MVGFSWNSWVGGLVGLNTARKPRRTRVEWIEGLEDRALLTANLPVAVDDAFTVDSQARMVGDVLDNDTDADGDKIKHAVLDTDVSHGTLKLTKSGKVIYTPEEGFVGTDTFTYFAKDVKNGEVSATAATVTITVTGTVEENTAPTVSSTTLSTTMDTALSGTLTATDAEGDTLTFAEGATAESNGTVVINSDGTFTFTPTAGFTGVATFSFTANDGDLTSDEATVTINVEEEAENTAPTVADITLSTTADSALTGTLTATDAEGDTLTFAEGVTAETNGTVVINPDGTFTFTPTAGFTGVATFSFNANDGSLASDDATVTINVTAEDEEDDGFELNLADSGTISLVNGDLIALDSDASLINVGKDADFANATIEVSLISGADDHKDRLVVMEDNDSNVEIRGKRILIDGEEVATISGGKKDKLTITFNADATEDDINTILHLIAIETKPNGDDGDRTIQVEVTAGDTTADGTIVASMS